MTHAEAESIVKSVLARGGRQQGAIYLGLAALLGTPGLYFTMTYIGGIARGDSELWLGPIAFIGTLLTVGLVCAVVGVRKLSARGTRVGRIVLDLPDQVHGVNYFIRDIQLQGGIQLRRVHVVSISVDSGDELEAHLPEHEVKRALEAFHVFLKGAPSVQLEPQLQL